MSSREEPIPTLRWITRSLARALASHLSATDRTEAVVPSPARRTSVQRVGVSFVGTNALPRAARAISRDPTFSLGARAAAEDVPRRSTDRSAETGLSRNADWLPYTLSDGDEDDLNSRWTSFSSVSSDLDGHELASWSEEEGSRTRRTASEPPASFNRKAAERRRLNDLARRLDESNLGDSRTKEDASSYEVTECTEGVVDPEFTRGVVSPVNP
jgi:hypothetical protein